MSVSNSKNKPSLVEDVVRFIQGRMSSDTKAEDVLKSHRKNNSHDAFTLRMAAEFYSEISEKLSRYEYGDIPASRNQLGNVSNPYQTKAKRVLTVCSAGLLRSPTTANVLHRKFGYNTRAAGSTTSFALIPVTEALIAWADEIVFVNNVNYHEVCETFDKRLERKDVVVLNVPDNYEWNDPVLQEIILEEYSQTKPFKHVSSKKK